MSSYVSLWIREEENRGTSAYIELDAWSRSTDLFQTLTNFVPYGSTVELKDEMIMESISSMECDISIQEDIVASYRNSINFLRTTKMDAEKLMDFFSEYQSCINEARNKIKELQESISSLQVYRDILSNLELNDWPAKLYLSYEDDPNFREKEKETE